jgi:Phage portal protein
MALRRWLAGPAIGRVAPPRVSAAAGAVALAPSRAVTGGPYRWGTGINLLASADFPTPPYLPWGDRAAAMSVPAISRARDLICSAVGALPFTLWSVDFTAAPPIEQSLPPAGWMARPDPDRTRQWMLAWTTDDLFFYGVAHWRIIRRYAAPNDYPAAFRRVEPGDVNVADDGTVTINGRPLDPRDVIEFLSPIEGILANGWRTISIALALDEAADRFAGAEVPAGILEEQAGGEDMSADELTEQAARFTEARRTNTTAATNKYLKYRESTSDPERLQLVQSRGYQALENARLTNVPPYLIGAPAGTGMTYQNAQQARSDLIDFGALPYIGCIEQTLGGPDVTPRGQAVRLDTNAWLRNPLIPEPGASPTDLEQAYNPEQAPAP